MLLSRGEVTVYNVILCLASINYFMTKMHNKANKNIKLDFNRDTHFVLNAIYSISKSRLYETLLF